jgi:glutathione S-transferase
MLKIHHIEGRRSERIAWLMEELGLPYELSFKLGDVPGSLMAMDGVHAMRMAPIVEDEGQVLVESGAITEYLLAKHGGGRMVPKAGTPDHLNYLIFMHFAEGSAAPRLLPPFFARFRGGEPDAQQMAAAGRVMSFVEAELAQRPYFGGDQFTGADIMMHFPMKLAVSLYRDRTLYPAMSAWFDKVTARPAFKAAMARALPNGPPSM